MKLYVMRHGAAEERAASHIDADRALTAAGRDRVRRVALALLEAGEEPHEMFTSPLVRAVQTAEILAHTTRLGERGAIVSARREIAPAGDLGGLVRVLALEIHKRVMLVGHEPDLSALVATLAGRMDQPFDKAMVVGIQVNGGGASGKLRFVLDPKTLRMHAEAPDDS
ncbi:MAG: phosphohistidine phosphatase SixA [Myxococcota bacterium]|nr:phosphohistidine phosphatase SixA [Myxococcota bacterium]